MHQSWADDLTKTYANIARVTVGRLAAGYLDGRVRNDAEDIESLANAAKAILTNDHLIEALVHNGRDFEAMTLLEARGMDREDAAVKVDDHRERQGKPRRNAKEGGK